MKSKLAKLIKINPVKTAWLKFRKKGGSIKLEYSQKICADAINVKIIVTKKSTGITRKSLVLISYGVSNINVVKF